MSCYRQQHIYSSTSQSTSSPSGLCCLLHLCQGVPPPFYHSSPIIGLQTALAFFAIWDMLIKNNLLANAHSLLNKSRTDQSDFNHSKTSARRSRRNYSRSQRVGNNLASHILCLMIQYRYQRKTWEGSRIGSFNLGLAVCCREMFQLQMHKQSKWC